MRSIFQVVLLSAIVGLIAFYFLQNSLFTFREVYRDLRFIVQNPAMSYDDKMRIYWWTVYDYYKFVNQVTDEDAVIVLPPQERPWLSSGNAGLARYFLYPRIFISGSLDSIPTNSDVDYVAVHFGEWDDAPKEKYGWPKFFIESNKIFYFNPQTKEINEVNGDYYPDFREGKMEGLIKLK